jgi:hypothetical protein
MDGVRLAGGRFFALGKAIDRFLADLPLAVPLIHFPATKRTPRRGWRQGSAAGKTSLIGLSDKLLSVFGIR